MWFEIFVYLHQLNEEVLHFLSFIVEFVKFFGKCQSIIHITTTFFKQTFYQFNIPFILFFCTIQK